MFQASNVAKKPIIVWYIIRNEYIASPTLF